MNEWRSEAIGGGSAYFLRWIQSLTVTFPSEGPRSARLGEPYFWGGSMQNRHSSNLDGKRWLMVAIDCRDDEIAYLLRQPTLVNSPFP